MASGESVVDLEVLEEYRKKYVIPPIEKRQAGRF